MTCNHLDFVARVEVNRFENRPGFFMADVKVSCAECGRAMQFFGLPTGISLNQPSIDATGCEARLPIRPYEKPEWMPDDVHKLRTN